MKPGDRIRDMLTDVSDQSALTAIRTFQADPHGVVRLLEMGERKSEQGATLNDTRLQTLEARWKRAQEIFDAAHYEHPDCPYARLRLDSLKALRREGISISYKTFDRHVSCLPTVKRERHKKS